MTSATDRRLAKLEASLTPREAVLHWLAEAQGYPGLSSTSAARSSGSRLRRRPSASLLTTSWRRFGRGARDNPGPMSTGRSAGHWSVVCDPRGLWHEWVDTNVNFHSRDRQSSRSRFSPTQPSPRSQRNHGIYARCDYEPGHTDEERICAREVRQQGWAGTAPDAAAAQSCMPDTGGRSRRCAPAAGR
jgi:hypothetical protein